MGLVYDHFKNNPTSKHINVTGDLSEGKDVAVMMNRNNDLFMRKFDGKIYRPYSVVAIPFYSGYIKNRNDGTYVLTESRASVSSRWVVDVYGDGSTHILLHSEVGMNPQPKLAEIQVHYPNAVLADIATKGTVKVQTVVLAGHKCIYDVNDEIVDYEPFNDEFGVFTKGSDFLPEATSYGLVTSGPLSYYMLPNGTVVGSHWKVTDFSGELQRWEAIAASQLTSNYIKFLSSEESKCSYRRFLFQNIDHVGDASMYPTMNYSYYDESGESRPNSYLLKIDGVEVTKADYTSSGYVHISDYLPGGINDSDLHVVEFYEYKNDAIITTDGYGNYLWPIRASAGHQGKSIYLGQHHSEILTLAKYATKDNIVPIITNGGAVTRLADAPSLPKELCQVSAFLTITAKVNIEIGSGNSYIVSNYSNYNFIRISNSGYVIFSDYLGHNGLTTDRIFSTVYPVVSSGDNTIFFVINGNTSKCYVNGLPVEVEIIDSTNGNFNTFDIPRSSVPWGVGSNLTIGCRENGTEYTKLVANIDITHRALNDREVLELHNHLMEAE